MRACIAWRPPAGAQTFRLHSAPEGGLRITGGAIAITVAEVSCWAPSMIVAIFAVFGALVQYPDEQGRLDDLKPFIDKAHAANVDAVAIRPEVSPMPSGTTLQVELLDFEPASWGWTASIPGFGLLAEDFPDGFYKVTRFDPADFAHDVDQIALLPHDLADILVSHGHLIQAG